MNHKSKALFKKSLLCAKKKISKFNKNKHLYLKFLELDMDDVEQYLITIGSYKELESVFAALDDFIKEYTDKGGDALYFENAPRAEFVLSIPLVKDILKNVKKR